MDDYTLYSDGEKFVAFGLDALWIAGYGPGEPFVTLKIGGGMTVAMFDAEAKEVVFGALREARKRMNQTLESMAREGLIEISGKQSTTLCQVKRLKVSVREFVDVQLETNGINRDELQHHPCQPVLNVLP